MMPPETNFYAFCADYSNMATCLFAIQNLSFNGAFAEYPELEQMLRVFEQSTLFKLYGRAVTLLQQVDGIETFPPAFPFGDFTDADFYTYDFNTGYLIGDFISSDFSNDFNLIFLDSRNTGYSSLFQTILNVVAELRIKITLLSATDIAGLDTSLVAVLDAFTAIQDYLTTNGLNPCVPAQDQYINNSTDVYLQAAGADGTDGIPEGIHLRWSLAGELGLNHIPKGAYDDAITVPALFNQPNDFVEISRTLYTNPVIFSVDFQQNSPSINYALRRWTYFINQTVNGVVLTNQISLSFTDEALYNQVAAGINPVGNYFDFLKAYTGILQLQVANKSLYRVDVNLVNSGADSVTLKMEAQCIADVNDTEAETVYARKTIIAPTGTNLPVTLLAENIQAVKLQVIGGGFLQSLSFETYHDFLKTRSTEDWVAVGNGYSLSLADQEVFDRLETAAYPVNEIWPQYNSGTTVRVANYHDKWLTDYTDDPSIRQVVGNYLSLSETDSRAVMTLADQSGTPDPSGLQISLVDMLNLVSTDFHIARMLGLGCIDVFAGDNGEQYVYCLSYTNQKSLTDVTPAARSYMSLPLGKADHLLPQQPQMRPITYGLPVVNDALSVGFNASGYALNGNTRAINIARQPFNDEIIGYDFFAASVQEDNTNIFTNSRPVSYGIKYRPVGQTAYVKPEITQSKVSGVIYNAYDIEFPATGIPETIPVPDNETSLYIHLEKQTGVHYYAIYGINWFSRASVISTELATDDTEFPLQNKLQPPTDVAVQYIQQEDTLLFTTAQEQEWLSGRQTSFPGQDINFTRVVFNWLDITDISSLPDTSQSSLATVIRPNLVNVLFDIDLPIEVQGIIGSIQSDTSTDNQLFIYTAPYTQIDGTILSPVIDNADFFRFNNSILNTPDGQFKVLEINAGITGPIITIQQAMQSSAQEDSDQSSSYGLVHTFQSPVTGSRFSMVENLGNAVNWQPVTEGITLQSFANASAPVIESATDSEGNIHMNWIGGITALAVVSALFTDQNTATDVPGCYQLQFSETLQPNPQVNMPFDPSNPGQNAPGTLHEAHVEWYKGLARIATASGSGIKQLEVLRIVQTDPLILIIYDPAYQDDPILVSATETNPVSVNFHPGYRSYLFAEPAPGMFNGTNILPVDSQISRKTMVGLQTANTGNGSSGFTSSVSLPAILLSRLMTSPVQLPMPVAISYVVRPNATGKAAFTFDVNIPQATDGTAGSPFGFKFCRTATEDVLDALYQPDTVASILAALGVLTTDNNASQRYFELVNLIFDPEQPGTFLVFDAVPQPYGFPIPDKSGLTNPDDMLDIKIQKYGLAVQGTILPLTATTPILKFIKTGFQTTNTQPIVRDNNGNLLDPSNPAFDPFPMIRQYTRESTPAGTYVRFTDYTLDASSRRLYFYAAAEVTNQLISGPLSQFAGPVTILNTIPPEEPIVNVFSVVSSDTGVVSPISIQFQLSRTAPYDNITAMRLYRTTNQALTGALMTMGTPVQVSVSDPDQTGYLLTDTFSDMNAIPFGDLLYYRIASIRTITNELNLPEDVLSIGSDVVTINLIDIVNPDALQLTYDADANMLSWVTTVNKGVYYLYQQNTKGNWTLLYTDITPQTDVNISYNLPAPLIKQDADGNTLYYSFKVRIQNSSGLFNLTDNILTV